MNFEKIIVSVFLSNEKVFRLSIGKFLSIALLLIIIVPYVYLARLAIKNYSTKAQVVSHHEETIGNKIASKNAIEIVDSKKKLPIVYSELIMDTYKAINLKTSMNGSDLEINFLLQKKISDNSISEGVIYAELLNPALKVISTSEHSHFKFTTARLTKFRMIKPIGVLAEKVRIRILSKKIAGSEDKVESSALFTIAGN